MRNLPSGTHVLVARHLGYAANAVSVDLSSRAQKTVSIMLPKSVNVMDPVLVTARRNAALDRVGFTRRKRVGMGYYVGPEQIELRKPNRLTDVLREIPGLQVRSVPGGEIVTTTRRGCVRYYVDYMPWRPMGPQDVNMFLNTKELVAVEVYQGMLVPAEFAGMQNCTAIIVWTKMRLHD